MRLILTLWILPLLASAAVPVRQTVVTDATGALLANTNFFKANQARMEAVLGSLQTQDAVSVRRFGAYGQGTNNTAALQAAFTSIRTNGGRLYIPAGEYVITEPLDLTSTDNDLIVPWILTGDGGSATVLRMAANVDCLRITPSKVSTIAGICLVGTNVTGSGITFSGPSVETKLEGVVIYGFSNGVFYAGDVIARNQFGNVIDHCLIAACSNGVYSVDEGIGLLTIGPGTEIRDCGYGVRTAGLNTKIRDSIIQANGYGVYIRSGSYGWELNGNHFEGNSRGHIWIKGGGVVDGLRVVGNWFTSEATDYNLYNDGADLIAFRWEDNTYGVPATITNVQLSATSTTSSFGWAVESDSTWVFGAGFPTIDGPGWATDRRVGIKAPYPTQALDVHGNIALSPASKIGSGLNYGGANWLNSLQFYNWTDGGITLESGSYAPIWFKQNGAYPFWIEGGIATAPMLKIVSTELYTARDVFLVDSTNNSGNASWRLSWTNSQYGWPQARISVTRESTQTNYALGLWSSRNGTMQQAVTLAGDGDLWASNNVRVARTNFAGYFVGSSDLLTNAVLTWSGPTNTLTLANGYQTAESGVDMCITNVAGVAAGESRWAVLVVSNSAASAVMLRITTPMRFYGDTGTNALTVAAGKTAILSVASLGTLTTNAATISQR